MTKIDDFAGGRMTTIFHTWGEAWNHAARTNGLIGSYTDAVFYSDGRIRAMARHDFAARWFRLVVS